MRAVPALLLVLLGLACTRCGTTDPAERDAITDRVVLGPGPGDAFGLLVDGAREGSGHWKEEPLASDEREFAFPNLRAPAHKRGIFAFRDDGAVERADAAWTPGPDRIEIPRRDRIRIGLTFHLLHAPHERDHDRAIEALIAAIAIFDDEITGIEIEADTTGRIHPVPEHDAREFLVVRADGFGALTARIPPKPGRIDVYCTGIVEGGGGSGTAFGVVPGSGEPLVALGAHSADPLLAHQIGHALGLVDRDEAMGFGAQFVMHPASDERGRFTEGESVAMSYGSFSLLTGAWSARTGHRPLEPLRLPSIRASIWPNPRAATGTPAAAAPIDRWLARDCAHAGGGREPALLGDPAPLAATLLARLRRERFLEEAERDAIRAAALRRFERRRAVLDANRVRLTPADSVRILAVTAEAYAARAVEEAEAGRRSAAMLLLPRIAPDSTEVRRYLEDQATTPGPLSRSARLGLERLGLERLGLERPGLERLER